MTIEAIARLLEPLALRLADIPDNALAPDAMLAKSLICFIMAIGQQFDGEERTALVARIATLLMPLILELP